MRTPAAAARKSGITLYGRVAGSLRTRLSSGDWPEGSRIPTIEALATEYGVARITVRQACQILAEEGLLRAQPGKGTFVARSPKDATLNAALDLYRTDREAFTIELESSEPVTQAPAVFKQHGTPAQRYMRIRKRHLLDGTPCGWMEIYVAADVYRCWPKGAERRLRLATLLGEAPHVHVRSGYELLEVGQASEAEAQRLDYPIGMPVARVTRLLADETQRIVYAGFNVYRGDRFRYEHDITGKVSYGSQGAAADPAASIAQEA